MAYQDFQEDLFKSIDTIIQARIANLPYDKTIECEVIDTSNSVSGIYTVQYQTATFEAISLVPNLVKNDIVYVSVPQSDFTKNKIILAKKPETAIRKVKILPFLTFVKGNNLFSNIQSATEYSIAVNNGNTMGTQFIFTTFNDEDVAAGFTKMGVKMTINSGIEQQLKTGDYGLKITIYGYDTRTTYLPSDDLLSIARQSIDNKYHKDFYLTTADMISTNPFNTQGYQNQEKTFDITGWVIDSITVSLYQSNDFKDIYNSNITNQRIFFTNLQLYLGYDIKEFDNIDTRLFIYTKDGLLYNINNYEKLIESRIVTIDRKNLSYSNASNLFVNTFSYYWEKYNPDNTDIGHNNKYGYEQIKDTNTSLNKNLKIELDPTSSQFQQKYCFTLCNESMLSVHNYISNELVFTQSTYGELVYDITEDKNIEIPITTMEGIIQIVGDNFFFKTQDGVTVLKLNTQNSQFIGNASTASSYSLDGALYKNLKAIETAIKALGGNYEVI